MRHIECGDLHQLRDVTGQSRQLYRQMLEDRPLSEYMHIVRKTYLICQKEGTALPRADAFMELLKKQR